MCHYNRILHTKLQHIGSTIVDSFKNIIVPLVSLTDLNTGIHSYTYHQKRLSLTALHFRASLPASLLIAGHQASRQISLFLSVLLWDFLQLLLLHSWFHFHHSTCIVGLLQVEGLVLSFPTFNNQIFSVPISRCYNSTRKLARLWRKLRNYARPTRIRRR